MTGETETNTEKEAEKPVEAKERVVLELDGRLFKESVLSWAALCDEGRLRFTPEGLELREMDPSQIALVRYELRTQGTIHYRCENPATVTVDLTELNKIAKTVKVGSKVKLTVKGDRVYVSIDKDRRYDIQCLESAEEDTRPKIPNIPHTVEVKLNSAILKDALKDLEDVGAGHVTAITEAGKGLMLRNLGDGLNAEAQIPEDKILQIDLRKPETQVRAQYSTEYLKNVLKAADKKHVTLAYSYEHPLQVDYQLSDHTHLTYWLAPRIETPGGT
jgi:proliferating cell nuclear antigen